MFLPRFKRTVAAMWTSFMTTSRVWKALKNPSLRKIANEFVELRNKLQKRKSSADCFPKQKIFWPQRQKVGAYF